MNSCKNCGSNINFLQDRAFVRLNQKIEALRNLLHELELKKQAQEQGFCDVLCEDRYHGDA